MRNWGYCELVCSFFRLSWLWSGGSISFTCRQSSSLPSSKPVAPPTFVLIIIERLHILHIANRIMHIANRALQIARFDAIEFLSHHLWAVGTLFSPGDTSLEVSALLSWEAGGEGTVARQQVVAQRGSPQKRSSWPGCLWGRSPAWTPPRPCQGEAPPGGKQTGWTHPPLAGKAATSLTTLDRC